MAVTKTNLSTFNNKVVMASAYEDAISTSNVYLGISKVSSWSSPPVPQPVENTQTLAEIFKSLIALKKVVSSDMNLVVPRENWASGTVYDNYTETEDLFSYDTLTTIQGTLTANSILGVNVVGSNTAFTSNLSQGDFLVLYGDGNDSPKIIKEVISIANNTHLTVNSAYSNSYNSNTAYKVTSSYPNYSHKFYVLNTSDEVFKCLDNNFGAQSTYMPQITSGSQLTLPYITTSDGYKWKFLYRIPSGMKEKFLTSVWMPVLSNTTVSTAAVGGRIDVVKIYDGGTEYLSGTTSSSADILSVSGDGSGANLRAIVTSGVITGIQFLDRGSDYTTVTISVNDPTQNVSGNAANIISVISPLKGHGYDAAYELGARNLMVSVDLSGTENGTIPVTVGAREFDYRQLILLKSPLAANGSALTASNYKAVKTLTTSPTGVGFTLDETVYVGASLPTSTFSGTVVYWDDANNSLWLNNTTGSISEGQTIQGQNVAVSILNIINSDYDQYTGDVLYIENRTPIVRNSNQTEQLKLILSF